MDFTCAHCNKTIHGLGIVYNKTHFLHSECEKDFKPEDIEDEIELVELED